RMLDLAGSDRNPRSRHEFLEHRNYVRYRRRAPRAQVVDVERMRWMIERSERAGDDVVDIRMVHRGIAALRKMQFLFRSNGIDEDLGDAGAWQTRSVDACDAQIDDVQAIHIAPRAAEVLRRELRRPIRHL